MNITMPNAQSLNATLTLLTALLLAPLAALQGGEALAKKPNVLWFLSDILADIVFAVELKEYRV